jgi:beta-lactamase regulating signal transducer with metallopeptidase domain
MMNPETIRVLGWCLLHFVWQGAVLALVLSVLLTRLRTPRTRYAVAVAVLALMLAAPVFTFAVLRQPAPESQPTPAGALTEIRGGLERMQSVAAALGAQPLPALPSVKSTDWLSYAVLAWVAGVYMFTLRSLGAWMLLMRLRRQRVEPIAGSLLDTCFALQARLGVTRSVRFVCSKALDVPAVLGWLRPVVVLPLSMLAGLTPWQIEALVAHELAHIKRWDAFVNLFQVATETLLFYHPAIWWVNRVIRSEREHCCDDIAVSACGNAPGYARALALLEEARIGSGLAMAANGGELTARIGRLLGVKKATRTMSAPSVAMLTAMIMVGALMGRSASTQVVGDLPEPAAPPPPVEAPPPVTLQTAPAPMIRVAPLHALVSVNMPQLQVAQLKLAQLQGASTAHRAHEAPAPADASGDGASYIDGLKSAGLKDLTVEQVIALKIHGVTPEYIRDLRAVGVDADSQQLVSLSIHQVTPEFVRELKAAGLSNLDVQDYLAARIQGITPEFIRSIRGHGFKDLTIHQLISLKIAGIS